MPVRILPASLATLLFPVLLSCERDFTLPFHPVPVPVPVPVKDPDTVSVGVREVVVMDMEFTFLTGLEPRIRAPRIEWTPADAVDKGYTLTSLDPAVARPKEGAVEAVAGGEARMVLTTRDGGRQAAFKVKVKTLLGCGLLTPCPDPGKGKGKGKGGDDDDDDEDD
jgi:hypothetical protein